MLFFMIVDGGKETKPPQQPHIDETLIERIGENDKTAFEELYYLTERCVYTYVLSIIKNPYDTQDIVQETYLKIKAAAHLYQARGKPLAWILTISRNLTMSYFRSHKKDNYSVDNWQQDIPLYSNISDVTDRMILIAALNILEQRNREIVLLYVVSGLKHREIAVALGLPLSTVLSAYRRSIKKLKKYLIEGGILA